MLKLTERTSLQSMLKFRRTKRRPALSQSTPLQYKSARPPPLPWPKEGNIGLAHANTVNTKFRT
jgi:hypothetical protein